MIERQNVTTCVCDRCHKTLWKDFDDGNLYIDEKLEIGGFFIEVVQPPCNDPKIHPIPEKTYHFCNVAEALEYFSFNNYIHEFKSVAQLRVLTKTENNKKKIVTIHETI